MVLDIEARGSEQRSHFLGDESLEALAGLEVGDDAALGAHGVVMVVRDGFSEFVAFASARTRNSAHHTGIDHFGQVAVRRALRHTRSLHHLVGGEWPVAVLEHRQYRPTVSREFQLVHRKYL